jgi:Dullard-like phosphatase family protein
MILKQHIIIETELNNIIGKILKQNKDYDSYANMVKSLIDLYNTCFNRLNEISFELNIFIEKNKNILLQKIIKLLIIFHCLIFILISLQDIYSFFLFIKSHYIEIFNNISFCLYNIFMKYILGDLKKYKYNDLSFIDKLNILYSINPKYNIKSTMADSEIFSLIQKNYLVCLNKFIKNLNDNDNDMKEILNSIKLLLLDINKKDLLYFIDICLNNFLYTILNKNIQKAILNSKYNISNKNNCALNSVPYLPKLPPDSKYKFTIVLDMDETLGHFISNEIKTKYFNNYGYLIDEDKYNFSKNYDNKDKLKVGIFLIRPYAKYFLEELNNLLYEIVIFTAGTKEYCDKILDILDLNNNLIKYRLYRSHLSLRNINNDVKDLSLLGRNLNKIIIIDNLPENYKLQEDNGLPINSWFGDINDSSLKNLLTIMKFIAEKNVKDVREVVRNIKIQFKNKKIKDYDYGKIDINF